jgi:hypothetical protein
MITVGVDDMTIVERKPEDKKVDDKKGYGWQNVAVVGGSAVIVAALFIRSCAPMLEKPRQCPPQKACPTLSCPVPAAAPRPAEAGRQALPSRLPARAGAAAIGQPGAMSFQERVES